MEVSAPMAFLSLPRSGLHYTERLLNLNTVEGIHRVGGNPHYITKGFLVEGSILQRLSKAVLVTKNPYAWLESFHRFTLIQPHKERCNTPERFSEFLREVRDYGMRFSGTPLDHWNFIQWVWLSARPRSYTIHVKYEALIVNSERALANVIHAHGLTRLAGAWQDEDMQVGSSGEVTAELNRRRWYADGGYLDGFSSEDISYVEEHLDGEVLAALRYGRMA